MNSSESGQDVSKKYKEAGGAQDNIFLTASDEDEDDEEDDEAEEVDDELTRLWEEMDALECQVYTTGTVASVFARTITQSQLTKKIGAEVLAAMEDIFQGNENLDPGAVTKALQPDTARARDYLAVVNLEVGFTLLHHLQRMDQEIRPGDPIVNRIVAFEGDI